MKQIIVILIGLIMTHNVLAQSNLGFELNSFKSWKCYSDPGTNLPSSNGVINTTEARLFTSTSSKAAAAPYQVITTGLVTDKYGKYAITCQLPGAGLHSAKLGDDLNLATAQGIRYSIKIPNDSFTHRIVYYYAVDLEDPGAHSCWEMPLFTVKLTDSAINQVIPSTAVSMDICSVKSDSTLYGRWGKSKTLSPNIDTVYYSSWLPITNIIPKKYAGRTITLEFMSAGCSPGGFPGIHFGYAYVDVDTFVDRYSQRNLDTVYFNPVGNNGNLILNEPPGYKIYTILDSVTNTILAISNTNLIPINPLPPNGAVIKVILTPYTGYGAMDTFFQHIVYRPLYNINGKTISHNGTAIKGSAIKIVGNIPQNSFTDSTGFYAFISDTNNTVIRPTKNNDINKTNGVTTLDLAYTQSHILGKNKLNNPYKIIAADVNGDGKISTLDLVYMKRLILGIDTTFINTITGENRLWAFIDSSYQFPDTTNPFPYKDSISYIGLNANQTNQTFIGIKLGDVNWDWNPALARMPGKVFVRPKMWRIE